MTNYYGTTVRVTAAAAVATAVISSSASANASASANTVSSSVATTDVTSSNKFNSNMNSNRNSNNSHSSSSSSDDSTVMNQFKNLPQFYSRYLHSTSTRSSEVRMISIGNDEPDENNDLTDTSITKNGEYNRKRRRKQHNEDAIRCDQLYSHHPDHKQNWKTTNVHQPTCDNYFSNATLTTATSSRNDISVASKDEILTQSKLPTTIILPSYQNFYRTLIRSNNVCFCEPTKNTATTVLKDDDKIEQKQVQVQAQAQVLKTVEESNDTTKKSYSNRTAEAMKQLFCGGIAGSVAKTITAPFSRLTILFQVHSLVTTKENRPYFAMSISSGVKKIIERGGITSLWRGNLTSVLHRFPYSAINFYCYENIMDVLATNSNNNNNNQKKQQEKDAQQQQQQQNFQREQEADATQQGHLVRRISRLVLIKSTSTDDANYTGSKTCEDDYDHSKIGSSTVPVSASSTTHQNPQHHNNNNNNNNNNTNTHNTPPAIHHFLAGAFAGTMACTACYPLDLVRARLTTELEGHEHYRGMVDAFKKIMKTEGILGFYSGLVPTLLVAVPNFAISYTVYGTLKEHMLDDELFYNLRRIDADSGETKLGYILTLLCGASSGILATLVTFPMDTVRRRMQVQTLHVPFNEQLTSYQTLHRLVTKEGLQSLYRGLTPEILKVIPMVGSMFFVYEYTKDLLNV